MLEHKDYEDFGRLVAYHDKKTWVGIVDQVVLVCFTLEMAIKLVAMGFFWERGSYLRFGWSVPPSQRPLRAPRRPMGQEEER